MTYALAEQSIANYQELVPSFSVHRRTTVFSTPLFAVFETAYTTSLQTSFLDGEHIFFDKTLITKYSMALETALDDLDEVKDEELQIHLPSMKALSRTLKTHTFLVPLFCKSFWADIKTVCSKWPRTLTWVSLFPFIVAVEVALCGIPRDFIERHPG